MGRGDKKTKRGKISAGSFGRRRPRKAKNVATLHGKEIKVNVKGKKAPKASKKEEE